MMTQLIKYDAARRALVEAKSVDEVKDVHDKAAAMRLYARMAGNKELEQNAAEIRIRAERRLGVMIAEQKATVGLAKGAAEAGTKRDGPRGTLRGIAQIPRSSLEDAGINKGLASRARAAAKLDDKQFESKVVKLRTAIVTPKSAAAFYAAQEEAESMPLEAEIEEKYLRAALTGRAAECVRLAVYSGPIDKGVVKVCRHVAETWNKLATRAKPEKRII